MKSNPLGTITSVEVTNISGHGVWLLASEQELFMSYEDFPWFKDVPVGKLLNVDEPKPGHFSWRIWTLISRPRSLRIQKWFL